MNVVRIRKISEINYSLITEEEFNNLTEQELNNLAEYYIFYDYDPKTNTGLNIIGERINVY